MTLKVEKIHDGGVELKKHKLVLYSNDTIRDEVLNIKKNELYYILNSDGAPVGYIQMTPQTLHGKEYILIHEIEIFSPYRSHGYGSKIVKYLRTIHEIIPIDIQEYAIGFWFKYLNQDYWKQLISEYGDINSMSTRLSYSDIIKRQIMSCLIQ